MRGICISVYLHLRHRAQPEEGSRTSPSLWADALRLPCPLPAVNGFAVYLQHLQDHSSVFSPPLVQGSWEMWLWPVREKGPLCVPAKAQLLLKPNWAAFPNYLHYSSGLHFQMPSFNLEQKLLSGLIYDPDLLTGPCGVPPLQDCTRLKLTSKASALQSLYLSFAPSQEKASESGCRWGGLPGVCPPAQLLGPAGKVHPSAAPASRPELQVTSRSCCGQKQAILEVVVLQRGFPSAAFI